MRSSAERAGARIEKLESRREDLRARRRRPRSTADRLQGRHAERNAGDLREASSREERELGELDDTLGRVRGRARRACAAVRGE